MTEILSWFLPFAANELQLSDLKPLKSLDGHQMSMSDLEVA